MIAGASPAAPRHTNLGSARDAAAAGVDRAVEGDRWRAQLALAVPDAGNSQRDAGVNVVVRVCAAARAGLQVDGDVVTGSLAVGPVAEADVGGVQVGNEDARDELVLVVAQADVPLLVLHIVAVAEVHRVQ